MSGLATGGHQIISFNRNNLSTLGRTKDFHSLAVSAEPNSQSFSSASLLKDTKSQESCALVSITSGGRLSMFQHQARKWPYNIFTVNFFFETTQKSQDIALAQPAHFFTFIFNCSSRVSCNSFQTMEDEPPCLGKPTGSSVFLELELVKALIWLIIHSFVLQEESQLVTSEPH